MHGEERGAEWWVTLRAEAGNAGRLSRLRERPPRSGG
jgi:hypothetical protein